MIQILWDEQPTARTHHECTSCSRFINPGEKYRRTRCIFEGETPYTVKECAHCQAFLKLYGREIQPDPYEGWTDDDIDQWEPTTERAIEDKRRWSIGWRHGRDLYPVPEAAQAEGARR